MGSQAIELFRQMPTGMANELTFLVVLNACSHSGLVDIGRSIFMNAPKKSERIYTAMVTILHFLRFSTIDLESDCLRLIV